MQIFFRLILRNVVHISGILTTRLNEYLIYSFQHVTNKNTRKSVNADTEPILPHTKRENCGTRTQFSFFISSILHVE